MKKLSVYFLVGFTGAILALLLNHYLINSRVQNIETGQQAPKENLQLNQTSYNPALAVNGPDFRLAAETTVNAVVHIQTSFKRKSSYYDDFFGQLWEFFEGMPYHGNQRIYRGFGSGVIVSNDGYIVTNNHVVQGASDIEVTLNDKRVYAAELIGNDPSTDLALIKIDARDLPYLTYGNSNDVEIGEWVLAVGNPFNLTSTVTAGIVSAKARNINILGSNSAIESYIQTDAAVNRGNSGGALVNTRGQLVGINAAIASNTGSYEGYSFAIPVNLVRKVVEDFMLYGEIQRAYIGVTIREVDADLADANNLENVSGVYINSISRDGGAEEAGMQSGDIIRVIDDVEVNTVSELLEVIGQHRPGDIIKIKALRDGDIKIFNVTLKNERGTTEVVVAEEEFVIEELGATLKKVDIGRSNYSTGLKVNDLGEGPLKLAGVREGFVIVKINQYPVESQIDVYNALDNLSTSQVRIEGIYPNGMHVMYTFNL